MRIGITGPIGCGKSTVSAMLAELGAAVIDADEVAREVRRVPAIEREIMERFGSTDPAVLARTVFADMAAMRDLEAIIHPAVRPQILTAIEAAEDRGAPAVVVEAIKLVEGGLATSCDEVWLVTCDPPIQRGRLHDRGLARDDAERRIASQGHLRDRVEPVATRRIDTSGSLDDTKAQVARAWSDLVR
ncbi:MAG TPA: dephospho-CoA kinase [Solirubrobacterales bacterium]|nr:dephospho-CoA kinase [Solirubrobacterales bacterium]